MASSSAPLVQTIRVLAPAVGTAGNDANTPAGIVPFAGVVSQVRYVPMAAMTGSSTARTLTVYNRGQAGAGTTVVAQKAHTAGVNSTSKTPNTIALSGTAANLVVAANDVLEWESLHVSTGITDPGGVVEIDISRTQSE